MSSLSRTGNNSTKKMISVRSCISARMFAFLCTVVLFSGISQSACAQSSAEEYQVKAAFLYHFAQLVDWPAGVPNAGDPSIKLCIFGDEPRHQELQSIIEGKTIAAGVLHVRLISQS